MGSLPRSRHAAPEPHALTVAPFDAAGAGVGDVPATVAIETPDSVTALIIYTEPEHPDALAFERCARAVDAFRVGYEEAAGRAITAALVAGIEAANDVLYTPRQKRDARRSGVGLTALAVRGVDAFVIQAGPGQALVAGGDSLIALPPFETRLRADGAFDDDHVPALGLYPALDPNLFHIDASGGLCATLCHSALAPFLRRGDDSPLRSFDAQAAAEHLVRLGERYHVSDACGVVVSATATEEVILPMPARRPPPARRAAPAPTPRPRRAAPPRAPYADRYDDNEAADFGREPELDEQFAPPPRYRTPPRRPPAPAFVPPRPARHEPAWFDDAGDVEDLDGAEWDEEEPLSASRYRADAPVRRSLGLGQLIGMPTRLVMFVAAIVCTLAVFIGITSVRAWTDHQANVRAIQQLDDIEGDRAQAEVIAQRDPTSAYTMLEPLVARLNAVVQSGKQTQRVQQEQLQLAKTFDLVGNITRVVPKLIGSLDHIDGAPGNHRLLLLGDDGQLYLYDHDDRGAWALFNYDPISGKRGAALFVQGQVSKASPSGELRGIFWSGGLATSDQTRLFVRATGGNWAEITLQNLPNRRPIAVAMANDTLYLLDNVAGAIVRVSLKDSTSAKSWTTAGAVADLKNAVDLTTDGQTVWVLLADGRVRGFDGNGNGTALFTPTALPPLKGAVAITTSATSPYLYVAEGNGGRILRIRKADGKLMQVLRSTGDPAPSLDTVQSMAVDEPHGLLWCATADGILSFPLPPLGV